MKINTLNKEDIKILKLWFLHHFKTKVDDAFYRYENLQNHLSDAERKLAIKLFGKIPKVYNHKDFDLLEEK